jgi:hypothetical protein
MDVRSLDRIAHDPKVDALDGQSTPGYRVQVFGHHVSPGSESINVVEVF